MSMKHNDKSKGIEVIKTGSDIDLLVTAILTRTVLVSEDIPSAFQNKTQNEPNHEDDGRLKLRTS